MATTIQQIIVTTYTRTSNKTSVLNRFINWCKGQQKNRFTWLGLALTVHGCALILITLFAVILSGNLIFFWIMALWQ